MRSSTLSLLLLRHRLRSEARPSRTVDYTTRVRQQDREALRRSEARAPIRRSTVIFRELVP